MYGWNKDLKNDSDEFETGNLFRHMYPLKIGAGCHGKCKYCTIKDTRGTTYYTDARKQVDEYLKHANSGVVLISDSPTVRQIHDWCSIAILHDKQISFRNVEPQNAIQCETQIRTLAEFGLLKIFHCPIQSNDALILEAMGRDVNATMKYISFSQELRELGVKIATNIIIDYIVDGKMIHNMDEKWLNDNFDYWSWNPYFDGNWNYDIAKERFERYIGD